MNFRLTFKLLSILIVLLNARFVAAQLTIEIADMASIRNIQDTIEKYRSNATAIDDDEMKALARLEEALLELHNYLNGKIINGNISEIADRYCEAAILVDSFGQPFQSVERVMLLGSEYYWLGMSIGKKLASKYNYQGKCISMGN